MTPGPDLFAANLAYFEAQLPAAAEVLRETVALTTVIADDAGRPINIDVSGQPLYPQPGPAHAAQQVAAYLARPRRHLAPAPEGTGSDSPVSVGFLRQMPELLRAVGVPTLADQPAGRPGYLVVIGLGLGLFLDRLIDAVDPHHVLIIEPHREFFLHAARAFDWAEMIDRHRRRGVTFDINFKVEPDQALAWISGMFQLHGEPMTDGAHIFTHYASWATDEIGRRFDEHVRRELLPRGYYEDEIKMIHNASENFLRHSFRLLDGAPQPRRSAPVFIVGAGPSLDDAIPVIKKWKDHAVIFSSGTALHILLHHGIVPDFQTELENHPTVIAAKLRNAADAYPDLFPTGKLSPIRLVASVTVAPEVPELFDERFLFFRGAVSSTLTFGRFNKPVPSVAPFVANTSLATAAMMGFGQVYLFGCDCGQRPGRRRHARHVIYETDADFAKIEQSNLVLTAPGNFGGTVNTDRLYQWSQVMIERTIETFHLDAANCSDGAKIEGARPQAPGGLKLPGPPLDKAALRKALTDSCVAFGPGEFLRAPGQDAYDRHWREFIVATRDLFARARRDDPDFESFHRRWKAFLSAADSQHGGVSAMVGGTGLALPRIAWFFLTRIALADARRAAFQGFLDLFELAFLGICEDGQARFAAWRARLAAAG